MRTSPLLLVCSASAIVAIAACSSDHPATAPDTFSGGDSSTASTGLTIVVDSAANNDTGTVGSPLPVRVHVSRNGAGVAGTAVAWTVVSGGGTLSSASTITDASGLATTKWVLGDTIGTESITAAITGATITINAEAVAGAAFGIAKVTADSQSVVAGGAVQLIARPVDRFGNPVPNAPVVWSSDGGALSTTSTISGANGNATSNFVAPATPGVYNVTASVPNVASVTFRVFAQ